MSRMSPDERYVQLLNSAVHVAENDGFIALTHRKVADHANVVKGTVFHHFKTIDLLRDAVMEVAINNGINSVIAAGVTNGNLIALNASDSVKRSALLSSI